MGKKVLKLNSLCTHEEADVILIMQTIDLAREGCSNLRVICDVFLLLLHHYALNNLDINLTLAQTSPQRAVVNIKESVKKIRK